MPGNLHQPLLIVEDSDEDFNVLKRFLGEAALESPIYRCIDGEDALAFLHQTGDYANAVQAPRPSLVLLDLNLPGTDGREVLQHIKDDPVLNMIPVVVLTSSGNPIDVESCYTAGANAYLLKPVHLEKFRHYVHAFVETWFAMSVLPGAK
jgi:CheY-like chemotaxis protein